MHKSPRFITIEEMVGETILEIGGDRSSELYFHTLSGKVFRMYHGQECCESVYIENGKGLDNLINAKIVEADELIGHESGTYGDSITHTTYKFKTEFGDRVIIEWKGSSNGYYSESVYLTVS